MKIPLQASCFCIPCVLCVRKILKHAKRVRRSVEKFKIFLPFWRGLKYEMGVEIEKFMGVGGVERVKNNK